MIELLGKKCQIGGKYHIFHLLPKSSRGGGADGVYYFKIYTHGKLTEFVSLFYKWIW